jgi:hypothetical protein
VPHCLAGYDYTETSHYQTQIGKGSFVGLYNKNASSANLSQMYDSSTSMTYTGSLGGSAEIDIIIATIGTNDSVTVGKTTGESTDSTATVNNIPAHEYGIIQLGDAFWNTSGTYYYESATCVESNQSSASGSLPENPNDTLILVGVNTSDSPPWAQQ